MFLPQMSLRFLSINDYLLRNFILLKCNTATDIWQSITRYNATNMHSLQSGVTFLDSHCPYHEDQTLAYFELDTYKKLCWVSDKKSKKPNQDPSEVLYILAVDPENQVTRFHPVHYCSYKHQKVRIGSNKFSLLETSSNIFSVFTGQ
jgi:hypothetical protein